MTSSHQSGQPDRQLPPTRGKFRQRKGVALILVVSFIVLLSALVVGFFSRVTTDLTGARSYAEGINARQLAESAVSVVMGQIRAATTITNGCWASQPGMIRVYGGSNGVAGSQAYRFYKLYSSHNLVLEDNSNHKQIANFTPNDTSPASGANAEVPIGTGGWQFQPAFFTDLNEPVSVPSTNNTGQTVKRYPIFDPSVARIPALGKNVGAVSGTWPSGSVEGCEVSLKDTATLTLNNAPMPVRWIYVLRDGTLTTPTPLSGPAPTGSTTGLKAIWNNIGNPLATPSTGVPSKENPIVGRIAFWTDDDTCKVNVNTAGGYVADEPASPDYRQANKGTKETNPAFIPGSFWDTPRFQTYFESGVSGPPDGQQSSAPVHYGLKNFRGGLASAQPVRNEFQRYPGHPSTTSLALVMKGLLPVGNALTSEMLYQMTPRLMFGASEGGSKQLVVYEQQLDPTVYALDPDPPAMVKRTYDPNNLKDPTTGQLLPSFHLLSSVDELFYTTLNNPDQSYPSLKNTVISNPDGSRITTEAELKLSSGTIAQDLIDRSRFFLTAHSRSSELNLFGRPRVCIWPIPTQKSEGSLLTLQDPYTHKTGIRNPSDDLIQFCSTVGANPIDKINDPQGLIRKGQFIFDREDCYSSTADFGRQRNKEIFAYLQEVTSNNKGKIPGWGQSFESKYSIGAGGRNQLLTEIFDYIRTVNLKDTSRDQRIDKVYGRDATKRDAAGNPPKKVDAAETKKGNARYAKRGIVVPTRTTINGVQVSGFGRFPTNSEISLVLYHGGYIYKPRSGGASDVEYNFDLVNERNYNSKPTTKKWFDNNDITEQLVRGFLIVETFNPMQGYGPVTVFNDFKGDGSVTPSEISQGKERIAYVITKISGFSITPEGGQPQELNIGKGKNNTYLVSGNTWAGRNFGGTEGFFHTMQGKVGNTPLNPTNPLFPWSSGVITYPAYGGPDAGGSRSNASAFTMNGSLGYYPFQSPCAEKLQGVRIPYPGIKQGQLGPNSAPQAAPLQTLSVSEGKITMELRYTDVAHLGLPAHDELIQTFEFDFPKGTNWPAPITEKDAADGKAGEGFRQDRGGFDPRIAGFNTNDTDADFGNNLTWSKNGGYRMPYYLPLRINWAQQHSYSPWTKLNKEGKQVGNGKDYALRFLQILQPGDTIRSLVPGGDVPKPIAASTDPRTTQLQQKVTNFKRHPDYDKNDPNVNLNRRAQTLRCANGTFYFDPTHPIWFPGEAGKPTTGMLAQLSGNTRYITLAAPDLPKRAVALQQNGKAADFDTGIGNFPDGGFCGKADEGNLSRSWKDEWGVWHYVEPYFSTWTYDAPGDTYFSPNRQIPSPVMFGSLLAPSTTMDMAGWKTLLFCPNPAAGYTQSEHHGFANPPDHLLLDLFNMPVVEPYAISEPFSTDGKVNLNFQLMPFGYIERSTALRAALHPLRVTAIPKGFTRKNGNATELAYKGTDNDENLRCLVDREETINEFKAFFGEFAPGRTGAGFFKSASQICEMFIYPKGQPISAKNSVHSAVKFTTGNTNIKAWWDDQTITGDNVREKPYSDLYSRVTTKSNTYTVHYRVQSLRQRPYTGNAAGAAAYYSTWDESRDQVLSEYRGHTTIERYLDPRDSNFTFAQTNPPAPQINPNTQSLETAYRFRVIYNKRFSPW